MLKDAFGRTKVHVLSASMRSFLLRAKAYLGYNVSLPVQGGDASNEGGLSVGVGAKGGAIQMTLYLIHMPTGSHPLRSSKSHY